MNRLRLAELAGLLAMVAALFIIVVGGLVALGNDSDLYGAREYFTDAALAGFVLAATCYALRQGLPDIVRSRAGVTPAGPGDPLDHDPVRR